MATNDFSAFSGLEATQLTGNSECLVTKNKTHDRMSMKKYAYLQYHEIYDTRTVKATKVKQTCGVDQCVNKDHLVATNKPKPLW